MRPSQKLFCVFIVRTMVEGPPSSKSSKDKVWGCRCASAKLALGVELSRDY